MFYAYIYRDRNGTPFYVGKGSGKRAWNFTRGNQRHLRNKIAKMRREDCPPSVEIIEALDEDHAKFLETCLIAVIGRKDLGLGSLLNLTDGGDGRVGWTEEQKKEHSAKITGQKRSQEVREKMSKAAKRRTKRDGSPAKKLVGRPSKLKGRKLSPEHKLKISNSLIGHQVTEETRSKMSLSHRKV